MIGSTVCNGIARARSARSNTIWGCFDLIGRCLAMTTFFVALHLIFTTTSFAEQSPVQLPSPMELQTALTEAGYYSYAIDGIVGPKTRAAVREFQKEEGLKVDGKCGKKTWAVLKKFLGEPEPEAKAEVSPEKDMPPEITQHNNHELSSTELKQKLVP